MVLWHATYRELIYITIKCIQLIYDFPPIMWIIIIHQFNWNQLQQNNNDYDNDFMYYGIRLRHNEIV